MADRKKKTRVPQSERRAGVIDAALIEFGRCGFDGTSTSMIATRAGIQQPYIYALFENKRHLFLACQEALYERMLGVFAEVIREDDPPHDRLQAVGAAYIGLIEDETWVKCHLQVLAASGHKDLQKAIRDGFVQTFDRVTAMTGAPPEEVARFFAFGTLLNAMSAMRAPQEMLAYLQMPDQAVP